MEAMRVESASDFGQAVRAARKEAGHSQMQLAKRCGCSQRFVSEVERGKETAELGRAFKLLEVLNAPLSVGTLAIDLDGRAEVQYAVVRIASEIDEKPRKRRPLSDYLDEASGPSGKALCDAPDGASHE